MLKGQIVTEIYRLCKHKDSIKCTLKTIIDTACKYHNEQELKEVYNDVKKGKVKPEVAILYLINFN
jgi:predicted transcriptional regulator